MSIKIEHIGICVKDLEDSIKKYTSLLGLEMKGIEKVEADDGVHSIAFLPAGDINVELLHSTASEGLIADFISNKGEGIHHIAFEVHNLDEIFQDLRSRRVEFLWDKIIEGSRGSRIAFINPKELNGVYIELIQKH